MKKMVLILIILLNTYAGSNKYINMLKHINQNQWMIYKFISHNASKYNLKYTLLAIAFKESQWGKYKLNLADPSAGLFHKLLPYYAIELGLKPNKWNESRLAERLINNNSESFMVALCDFKKAYKYFRTRGYSKSLSWRYAIQAYNAGLNNYHAGSKYYKEIIKIIKALKKLGY